MVVRKQRLCPLGASIRGVNAQLALNSMLLAKKKPVPFLASIWSKKLEIPKVVNFFYEIKNTLFQNFLLVCYVSIVGEVNFFYEIKNTLFQNFLLVCYVSYQCLIILCECVIFHLQEYYPQDWSVAGGSGGEKISI